MSIIHLEDKLRGYGQWREQLSQAVERYRSWLDQHELNSDAVNETLLGMLDSLRADRIVLAFAAEFSRGKTELINALFFSDTGVRLLPSSPGRTTMCPTEIFYDPEGGAYIRLLAIESRLNQASLSEYKRHPQSWMQIELDCTSPVQMQEAFQELTATKRVPLEEAKQLGLYNEDLHPGQVVAPETVEIPCWRHALISFPHYLLKEGLTILDTPGLNALGAEPELTLHMLPSAQAVIFVLAADTGVTKSDLDMWCNHVRGSRQGQQKRSGLAVVMNKIDSMWGDLHGDDVIEKSIRAQIDSVARTLEVDASSIFPLTAKQALLAKVKGDQELLEKSRLHLFESFLAEKVVKERQNLLMTSVTERIGHLVTESTGVLQAHIADAERQINDLRNVDVNNRDKIKQLMTETRDQQNAYLASVNQFQASRRVFAVQAKALVESLAPESIDEIIKRTRRQMAGSLTTIGMKSVMAGVLEELNGVLVKAVSISEESRKLVKGIYGKFQEEYGFADLKAPSLSLKKYQAELERVFKEGEAFRDSASSTLMEQSMVVVKLYTTVVARARELFLHAHKDAVGWSGMALTPLIHQIRDHKRVIESKLDVLRKINESSHSLDQEIAALTQALEPLRRQYDELLAIRQAMQLDDVQPEVEAEEGPFQPAEAVAG
ncbi:dynamin family protein [Methylocaldum sp. GT1BB]|uniref:dynamin family protein n=1 Tax=Methylocaldum sp. GT1BB TaxID=3438963 RepID=UPI003DA03D4E